MRNYGAKDVDSYIASSSEEARPKLRELRKLILTTIPKAEERISWGVPFYRHQGLLVGIAAFKNHVNFGLPDAIQSKYRKTLEEKGYTTGMKTIQIKFDQKVPATELRQLLREKAKSNEVEKANKLVSRHSIAL